MAVVRSTGEKEAGPTQAALCDLGAKHRLLCARFLSRAPSMRGCGVLGSRPPPWRSPAPDGHTPTPSPLLPPHEKVNSTGAEAACHEPTSPTPRAEPSTHRRPGVHGRSLEGCSRAELLWGTKPSSWTSPSPGPGWAHQAAPLGFSDLTH